MKRGSVNSRQFFGSLENSKITLKYNSLLEDYLELQKEYVSKKKKLQVEKQKQEVLLNEVRFLRQRHNYLTKSQSVKVEPELGHHQNADINDVPIRKERNYIVKEANIEQEGNGGEELVWKTPSIEKKPMSKKKKPTNFLINDKKSGKRKISLHDKVALKV